MATRIREKAEKRQANKDTRPYAKVKYVRMSPSKVRIVLDCIRNKGAEEAVAILANMPLEAAAVSCKLLKSAIANAENNNGLNKSELYVAETFADGGPTLKRNQPVSKGRAHSILKRTCHITVKLDVKKA